MNSSSEYHSLPIYQKSQSLCTMSTAVASYFSYSNNRLKHQKSASLRNNIANSILEDAYLIRSNIEQIANDNYDAKNSKYLNYINIMIRNIQSYCTGLEKDGVKEKEYVDLLRKEIKSFRKSFRVWRKSLH